MIILIDNYDSFTYNLVHYLEELGAEIKVYRNDEISSQDVMAKNPKAILISPGPSDPDKAGISMNIISDAIKNDTPLLGVCLGHQAIGQVCGGEIIRIPPVHGKTSPILHDGKSVFVGLPSPFEATRYHSLAIASDSLPDCLDITAQTDDGVIMGIQHKDHPIHGVQFHPESICTNYGHDMLRNFLDII